MSAPRRFEVLVVEDSEVDVELVLSSARRLGRTDQLRVVRSGEAALEALGSDGGRIGLVLLDLNLPGAHGLDVLASIRRDPSYRTVPVVILTSSVADSDVTRAYELGVNAFVRKPIGLDETERLLEVICNFWCEVVRVPSPPRH